MIFEQVLKVIVRQPFTLGISRRAAIRPAAVQTPGRGNPERAVPVFKQICDNTLLCIFVRNSDIHRSQREALIASFQPGESLLSTAPNPAVAIFEPHSAALRA